MEYLVAIGIRAEYSTKYNHTNCIGIINQIGRVEEPSLRRYRVWGDRRGDRPREESRSLCTAGDSTEKYRYININIDIDI